MKMLKEFFLDAINFGTQTCYLPANAEIVAAHFNNNILSIIALVNPVELLTTLRTFKICNVDENIHSDTVKYIGSFSTEFGIRHVVEFI